MVSIKQIIFTITFRGLPKILCEQRGIILIEVPEIPRLLPIKKVKDFIKKECGRYNILLDKDYDDKLLDLKKAYATSNSRAEMMGLEKIVEKYGGKCLSEYYIDSATKLLWECAEGHQWKASPNTIKRGQWCPYCANCVKLTIEDMRQIAISRNGKCLSSDYINLNSKLLWECSEGHQWEATPLHIKHSNSWCPICSGSEKLSIKEMQMIAEKRGGKCLSEVYVNIFTKLVWECANGHRWEAVPNNVKTGYWCPYCAGKIKMTIEQMQTIAENRGGKCLSTEYTNCNTKLLWECSKGHRWNTTPISVKTGTWCPYCANKECGEMQKLDIEEMQEIAKDKGGKCLSEKYINANSKLLWECSKGHRWEAKPSTIKMGHWCPACSGTARLIIEEMREIANNRSGKCLSEIYVNNRTKLLWECEKGHQWMAKPAHIKNGSWCPLCRNTYTL